ncbi:MAG: DUF1178 family protein [Pseudomonadota bacterium]
MIKYSLKCTEGHTFDSWFASADAYDDLAGAGRLSCAICGIASVEKAMMAPRVATKDLPEGPTPAAPDPSPSPPATPLAAPGSPEEAALAALRAKVEATTEDVGSQFADEARAIHNGAAPERAIRGQAKPKEARALIEDGVPILPLPFPPTRQVN